MKQAVENQMLSLTHLATSAYQQKGLHCNEVIITTNTLRMAPQKFSKLWNRGAYELTLSFESILTL